MKIIEIFDGNYSKDKLYGHTRYAVRAVIINNGKLLVEHASTPKMLMLPGGGIERDESNDECVIRECKEECGLVVEPIKELFAIREYFHELIFFSTYTLCRIVGECEKSYTDNERSLGLVCDWRDGEEILYQLEALMQEYKDGDEELYCCHKREYLAVKELISNYKDI